MQTKPTSRLQLVNGESLVSKEYAITCEAVRDVIHLAAIRNRLQRSLDDSRSNLTGIQIRKNLDKLYAQYKDA